MNHIQEGIHWVKDHGRDLAVGASVVIGTTLTGTIYVEQAQRMSALEQELYGMKKRVFADEAVIGVLIEEDIATTDALCNSARLFLPLAGLPGPSEEDCLGNDIAAKAYWREILRQAMEAGGTK